MTNRTEPWPAGTPCWTDIMTSDLAASQEFYRAVLGWDFTEGVPEFGGYANALVGGRPVAGLSPTMPGMEDAPKVWAVYLSTDDIAATTAAVTEGGGQVMLAPMQIGDEGSMAIYLDPTGAAFGAFEPRNHTGFQAYDEPGSVAWCDETTTDYEAAKTFYSTVFGYTYDDIDGMPYAMFTVAGGDRPAGGIGAAQPGDEPVTPHWGVCFNVEDVDASAQVVRGAGGSVLTEPFDFEFGRLLVAQGPDAERFSLISGGPRTS